MKNFIQKVNVTGLSANSVIEEALRRNGVGSEFLAIPEIRDDIINFLKTEQIKKDKIRIITTEEDLLKNIDKVIVEKLEIKNNRVRLMGNNFSEQIGSEENKCSTKEVAFMKTEEGIKKVEYKITKTYQNNLPEMSSIANYMELRRTEKVFGKFGEIQQVRDKIASTRDGVNGRTKMSRSFFETAKLTGEKLTRIRRNVEQEYATIDMYQEIDTVGLPGKKILKVKESNYRLRGNELVDLMLGEEAEKRIFESLTIEDFCKDNLEKKVKLDKRKVSPEELAAEVQKLDESKKKIALKMFGERIPNNPEFQEGIGENV